MADIKPINVIVSYEAKTEKFRSEQAAIAKEAKGLDKIFSKVKNTIAGLFALDTAIKIFKDATKTINEFQSSLKQLESLTGLSGDQVELLGKKAIELSSNFGTSAKDIVDGFTKVGSAAPQLLGNSDALAEVTKQADILSKAAGITLDEAIDAVTKTMNQYGLDASQAAEITDTLATSQQKGTATIQLLNESMKNVGSTAAALNISVDDTNAALQGLAKGGLVGAEAGTKLRAVYSKLANTGREELNPATQKFADILDTLANEGYTDVTKATELFGEENFSTALTLIKQRDTVRELTGTLNEHGNALAQATTNTDTNADALKRSAAAWDALVLSIDSGDGIISKAIKGFIESATELLSILKDINTIGIESFSDFNRVSDLIVTQTGRSILRMDALSKRAQDAFDRSDNIEGYRLSIERVDIAITELNRTLDRNDLNNKERARFEIELQQALNERGRLTERLNYVTEREAEISAYAAEIKKTENAASESQVVTLGKLKAQLAELKKERENIDITDRSSLRNNERLTLVLEEQIKSLEITKTKTKDLNEARREALETERMLAALSIGLIDDPIKKQIASLRLAAKIKIEDSKGTEEQISEQTLLIQLQLYDDIQKIVKQHNDTLLKMNDEYFKELADQEEKRLAKIDQQAQTALENKTTRQEITIKEQVKNEVITQEEGQRQIALVRLAALREQLSLVAGNEAKFLAIKKAIVEAEIALEEDLTDKTKKEQEERLESAKKAVDSIVTILGAVFDSEEEKIERSISLQKQRVAEITGIVSEGNAELLQLEEQRLRKLQEQQEAAAKKRQRIQALQIAANAALSVSNTITTITEGGVQGGVPGIIATGLALAATVAAAIVGIKSALADVPAYRDGVDVFKGLGTSRSDSNVVRISTGERVVSADKNAKLVKMGVTNDNIVKVASMGMQAINAPSLPQKAFSPVRVKDNSNDIRQLRKDIKRQTLVIQNLGVSATIDEKGFTARIGKRNKFKERRQNLLR